MKTRVQKFQANGFYLLSGNASANSLFFEDAQDQKLFLKLLERFLGDVIDLHFYSTQSTSWQLCFKIKSEVEIRQAYFKLKEKSKKQNSKFYDMDAGKMVSEHFRYFLSAYVKQSNFRHGRKGVRVHSKMEKYVFEDIEGMELEIVKMKKMKSSNRQKPKYRPDMRYYLVEKQLARNSVWRHSFVGLGGEKLVQAVIPCFRYILHKIDLLRQLISETWKLHFGPKIDPFPPPALE